jgi:hypothetical protein
LGCFQEQIHSCTPLLCRPHLDLPIDKRGWLRRCKSKWRCGTLPWPTSAHFCTVPAILPTLDQSLAGSPNMVSNKSAILLRHAWCQQRVLDCCERRQHNLLQLWGWFRRWLLVAIIVCLVGSKVTSHVSHAAMSEPISL